MVGPARTLRGLLGALVGRYAWPGLLAPVLRIGSLTEGAARDVDLLGFLCLFCLRRCGLVPWMRLVESARQAGLVADQHANDQRLRRAFMVRTNDAIPYLCRCAT